MQRYFAKNKQDNYLILHNSDIHHIKNVMRMSEQDEIECIYNKKLYICKIEDLNLNKIKIIEELNDYNELSVEITIAISLVKEQKMDLILQKLTELGVARIIPLKTKRSIIKIDDKRYKKKKERWTTICKEASEQSKRNIIPEITDIKTIKELNNVDYDLKCVCSVSNKENLINNFLKENPNYNKIIFVIGPEGGIDKEEEQLLNSLGFTSISLGSRILRVETAAIYIASILNFKNIDN